MAVDITALLERIPGKEQNYGILDEEALELVDEIDSELIKKGTLTGDSIDWPKLATKAEALLLKASHLQGFRALMLSLNSQGGLFAIRSATEIAHKLFDTGYSNMHPTGSKQVRRRTVWAQEILNVLAQSIEALGSGVAGLISSHGDKIEVIIRAAKEAELDVKALKQAQARSKITQDGGGEGLPSSLTSPREDYADGVHKELDARGRAALRRDMLTLSNRINAHDPDAAIGYALRGYISWLEFGFLPEANEKGVTSLQKMPASLVEVHRTQLENPSLRGLSKLEQQLVTSPDWFEGQKIAFELANALEFTQAAAAIKARCIGRLDAWPGFYNLKYSNETPFVSGEIKAWLKKHGQGGGGKEKKSRAGVQHKTDDTLTTLVTTANKAVESARSLRERALAKFNLACGLKSEGQRAQAKMMLEELLSLIDTTSAANWDEDLLKKIKHELRGL